MKKIFVSLLIVIVVCITHSAITNAEEPPETVVMRHVASGEVICDPLTRYLMSKVSVKLYTWPYYDSEEAGYLQPNRLAKITDYETHCFPYKNAIEMDGQTVYLLMYRGEGHYSVWIDGKIISKDMQTNRINTESRLWLKINNPDTGDEGWINYVDYGYKSFFHDISSIFLNPEGTSRWSC